MGGEIAGLVVWRLLSRVINIPQSSLYLLSSKKLRHKNVKSGLMHFPIHMYSDTDGSRGRGSRGKCPSRRNLGRTFNVSMPPASFSLAHQKVQARKNMRKKETLFVFIRNQFAGCINDIVFSGHNSRKNCHVPTSWLCSNLQATTYISKTYNLQPTSSGPIPTVGIRTIHLSRAKQARYLLTLGLAGTGHFASFHGTRMVRRW